MNKSRWIVSKFKINKITITFSEYPGLNGATYSTLEAANKEIRWKHWLSRNDNCYYKIDLTIQWEDNEQYKTRFYINGGIPDLITHLEKEKQIVSTNQDYYKRFFLNHLIQ